MFDPYHKWLGIPAAEQPPNVYRLLGIALFEDDVEVIDGAADKHLAFLHGLANGEHSEMAETISNEVSAARLLLLNSEKKAAYDQKLREESSQASHDTTPQTPVYSQPIAPASLPPPTLGTGPASNPIASVNSGDPAQVPAWPGQSAPLSQPSTQQTSNPSSPPNPPPLVNRESVSYRSESRSQNATVIYILPAMVLLGVICALLYIGKLKFDERKLKAMGVPEEYIPGSSSSTSPTKSPTNSSSSSSSSTTSTSVPQSVPPTPQPTGDSGGDLNPSSSGVDANNLRMATQQETQSNTSQSNVQRPPQNSFTNVSPTPGVSTRNQSPPPQTLSTRPTPPSKPGVPSADLLKEKMDVVRDLYQEQYRQAKDSSQKLAIAQDMVSTAHQTNDDDAGRFALLRVARDIFSGEHDYAGAEKAINAMDQYFDSVDTIGLRKDLLQSIGTVPATKATSYWDAVLAVARDAMREQQFAVGESILQNAQAKVPSREMVTFKKLLSDLQDGRALYEAYESSASVLESTPTDPQANMDVGLYLCLIDNEWQHGLLYLSRCDNPALKAAAEAEMSQEQQNPTDSKIDVAESWYQVANQTKSEMRRLFFLQHAAQWYRKAHPSSRGLETIKIDRRLKEIEPLLAKSQSAPSDSTKPKSRPTRDGTPALVSSDTYHSASYYRDFAKIQNNVVSIGMGDTTAGLGEAAGGLNLQNVEKIAVAGAASHGSMRNIDPYSKTGFFVDYETSQGYTKRVFLSCTTTIGLRFTKNPPWGCGTTPHETVYIGRRNAYQFDLDDWAPDGWTGTCWFSVYMQNTGDDRSLVATVGWKGR